MPPKRKGRAAAATTKRAKKPDWRVPLFYWHGEVKQGTWQGTWVASEDGPPSAADYAGSANTFKLVAATSTLHDALTGSYKLDNGDGPANYSDVEHKVHSINVVSKAGTNFILFGARGDTEFGPFLSMGVRHGNTLTLARRYIDAKDPRMKLSYMDVIEKHCPAICASGGVGLGCEYEPEEFLAKLQDDLLPWQFEGALERVAKEAEKPAASVAPEAASAPAPRGQPLPTNPHVAFFRGRRSDANPHMSFALAK